MRGYYACSASFPVSFGSPSSHLSFPIIGIGRPRTLVHLRCIHGQYSRCLPSHGHTAPAPISGDRISTASILTTSIQWLESYCLPSIQLLRGEILLHTTSIRGFRKHARITLAIRSISRSRWSRPLCLALALVGSASFWNHMTLRLDAQTVDQLSMHFLSATSFYFSTSAILPILKWRSLELLRTGMRG